jgi:hypothetical protein
MCAAILSRNCLYGCSGNYVYTVVVGRKGETTVMQKSK